MRIQWKPLTGLAKRSAGWSKGLELPGGAEQKPFGLLSAEDDELTFVCRGPHGYLCDSISGEGKDFEVGALPASLLSEVSLVHGRSEIDLDCESKDGRDRFLITADGYRRPLLMDHISGFLPEEKVSMALPRVSGDPVSSASVYGYQLQGLLKAALLGAPTSELNAARAIVSLAFDEEVATASATDGRLLVCARTELEKPNAAPMAVHLETEAASRLYGLLHSIDDVELVALDVMADGEERYLQVSFEDSPAVALMPLALDAGLPVERLLAETKGRESLATVVVSPRTCADLTAISLEKSCVLEGDEHLLKVWTRADVDSAEEMASVAVVVPHQEVHPGRIAVDSKVLSQVVKFLAGETIEFSVAKAKNDVGLLTIEQLSEGDVTVLCGVVGLNSAEA